MPKQAGAPAFPKKGIDTVKMLRALNVEQMDLSELCPPEDRVAYLHAQEKYTVKMIMRLLTGGEFDKPIKDLSLELKSLREHKLELLGRRQRDMTEIEESAMYGNGQLHNEGLYLDRVVQSDVKQLASIIAETMMRRTSLKESILKAISQLQPQKEEEDLAQEKSRRGKRRKNKNPRRLATKVRRRRGSLIYLV
jgi:hypothetical protein